jgi:hypothetical protein
MIRAIQKHLTVKFRNKLKRLSKSNTTHRINSNYYKNLAHFFIAIKSFENAIFLTRIFASRQVMLPVVTNIAKMREFITC